MNPPAPVTSTRCSERIADLLPGVVPGHLETTPPGVTLLDHGDRRSDILSRHQRRSAALDDADKVLYDQSPGIADCADAWIEGDLLALSRPRRELDGVPVVDAPDDGSCLAFDPEAVSQLAQPSEVHLSARPPSVNETFATAS